MAYVNDNETETEEVRETDTNVIYVATDKSMEGEVFDGPEGVEVFQATVLKS